MVQSVLNLGERLITVVAPRADAAACCAPECWTTARCVGSCIQTCRYCVNCRCESVLKGCTLNCAAAVPC